MNPFLWLLLLANLGAMGVFAGQGKGAWAVIYAGAALIQAGCLWASR